MLIVPVNSDISASITRAEPVKPVISTLITPAPVILPVLMILFISTLIVPLFVIYSTVSSFEL